jgi:hypothetical protein
MTRALPVCALLLALPLAGRADDKSEPTETVIRLTVRPAAAPKPALRYQLLPEMRELNHGNAAQAYLICFMEQNNFFHGKEAVDNREKWQTMPLKELPLKELHQGGYGKGQGPLTQADYAARLDSVDWQVLPKIKKDTYKTLLPELQSLRNLASALKVRFRVEVAERRFDDALVTAKTLLTLARQLGEHPTMISELVGIAVVYVAVGPLEEMIEQPGSPNLFWALTDLPRPLVDLRKGAQSERLLLADLFAVLDDQAPMTEAQLKAVVERVRALMKDLNLLRWQNEDVGDWLAGRAKEEAHVAAARKRLAAVGLAEAKVKTFPALQVVLLDDKFAYEVRRDDALKTLALPYWQAEPLLDLRPDLETDKSLFMGLISNFKKVRQAQARMEQRLALLCCVEALRTYAAEHDGKLPARLADIKLPLPDDPVTGKPFAYKLDGGAAILRGTPPKGQEKVAVYNVRYEVTIKK